MAKYIATAPVKVLHDDQTLRSEGVQHLHLRTDEGDIACRLTRPALAARGGAAILWAGGPFGEPDNPPSCLYDRLSERLAFDGIASLFLNYRNPGSLPDSIADVLIGISYLVDQGCERIALVGYAFGGAVVLNAGAISPAVAAVAAIDCQDQGTEAISRISPRPLLLIHGLDDNHRGVSRVRTLYHRAGHPKDLILYLRGRHSRDEYQERLENELAAWLQRILPG